MLQVSMVDTKGYISYLLCWSLSTHKHYLLASPPPYAAACVIFPLNPPSKRTRGVGFPPCLWTAIQKWKPPL